ncbi:hypothetical protein D3C71_2188710 [compost metagenome]
MAHFSGIAGGSTIQLILQDNARADADAYADIDQVGDIPADAEFLFPHSSGIGFIVDDYRYLKLRLQQ